jgi:hypothetical protein
MVVMTEVSSFSFKHPFNCIISAPTKSGKTEFTKKLILNAELLFDKPPRKIYWCYAEWQPAYDDLLTKRPDIQFVNSTPDIDTLKSNADTSQLLVMDDMMDTMRRSEGSLDKLFTTSSHHWNLSIIHIVQNAFYMGLRTSRINCQYLVLMKNPADRLQVKTLGRFIFPESTKAFEEAFIDATNKPYGYLLIDLSQTTSDKMRLRTSIFPDDEYQYVYVPRN